MARYRIVIEIDTYVEAKRKLVNELATEMTDLAVTSWSNPVFLSTEQIMTIEEIQILRQK